MHNAKLIRFSLFGLISVVVGGGIFATATMVDLRKEINRGHAVEPFYGIHQNGIELARQANLTLIAFNLKEAKTKSDVARLMRVWSLDSAELTQGKPIIGDSQSEMAENPARLTILFGFGNSLFEKTGISQLWPIKDRRIPHYDIDKFEENTSGGDFVVQITGDNPQSIFHAAQVLERDGAPFVDVAWQQRGFLDPAGINTDSVSRNLMGQLDGTANKPIATSVFSTIAWNQSGALQNGTTMVIRRIRINFETWDRLSTLRKSEALGRTLDNGEKIESKSATSHVTRAFTHGASGIIRRGFNYDDNYLSDGTRDAGLIFISFQAHLSQYLAIQEKLNSQDDLNRWTTAVDSALFIIPAGIEKRDYIGSAFFK